MAKQDAGSRTKTLILDVCTWIDIEKPTRDDIDALSRGYGFPALQEDFLTKTHPAKILDYRENLLAILHFPMVDKQRGKIKSSQLMVFLGDDHLVTLHQDEIEPLERIRQACKSDEKLRQEYMGKGAAYLFYRVLDSLVDGFSLVFEDLRNSLDGIERRILDSKAIVSNDITVLRRKVADSRRTIFPLIHEMTELASKVQKYSPESISTLFRDLSERIESSLDELDQMKEKAEIYEDADHLLATNRSNRILAVLTTILTFFAPITLALTFYEVLNAPGANTTMPFLFLGPYSALIVLLILSLLPGIIISIAFRRKGWI